MSDSRILLFADPDFRLGHAERMHASAKKIRVALAKRLDQHSVPEFSQSLPCPIYNANAIDQCTEKQQEFIRSFEITSNISATCIEIGIDRGTFYRWIQHNKDFNEICQSLSSKRQDRFLQAFALTSNVSLAAQQAGVDRTTVYRWLGNDDRFRSLYQQIEVGNDN